jgi:benzoyl-CoA reductase/2-hydroxyglutaryl-CoA dehydratase subunit BcrC/BadD/HgdB
MGGDYLPARCCPLVKATVGKLCALQEVSGFKLDLIVVPTTCDQRRKAVDHLREMGWRVYPLEVPPVKSSEEAQYYWRNSIKNLCLALEKLTGRRLTRKGLKESIDTLNQSRREYRRLTDRMSSSPSAIPGTDVMLVAHTRFFQEPHRWARAVAALNQELESRTGEVLPSRKVHPPRILLTGSPPIFPNIKLPLLIETSGALLVADEVCSSFRLLHDTVSYDEENLYDMIPALADRYLKPSTCPFQVDNSDRIRRLLDLAERSGVHGVVYQSFSGCSPYEMEQRTVAHALRERGVPMLGIETDYSHEDMGQLTTRIEAFVESIRIRKQEV